MDKKIIFMGTPVFAVPILKSLYQNGYPISAVYTQPPHKSHRGQKLNKSSIQVISETLNIDFRCPENLHNNNEEYEFIKNLKADLAIVVAYGKIIPENFLKLTKKGFVNIHGSILPKWRGAAPIQRSIINLDKETGISIMKIEEKLDTGPICNSYKLKILENENTETISEKLSLLAAEKILDNIDSILSNEANFVNQDNKEASYATKIKKSEGEINWNEKAETIIGKINGLYPSPGAWFLYNNQRYKVLKAEIGNGTGVPGLVLNEYLEICCKNKSIKILEIQREGKRSQNINEFILGSKIKKESNLVNA